MATVVLTGAAGSLGDRVVALAEADPAVDRVVRVPTGSSAAELTQACDGVAALVLLADEDADAPAAERLAGPYTDGHMATARDALAAADATGVASVVLVSTAAVYGAWANSPVPLTEEAGLRPHPGLAFAVRAAELERLAHEWRQAHPDARVAVLRPAAAVADDARGWLTRALDAASPVQAGEQAAPVQFVHLDDVAAAVHLAHAQRLDGPFNVAPHGHLTREAQRALAGRPDLRLPEAVAVRLAGWRWRSGRAPTPPALVAYTRHPWVVANDRLVAAGWTPSHSNEEAWVAGHQPGRLATLSPSRRQQLALAGAGAAMAVTLGAIAAVTRRRR